MKIACVADVKCTLGEGPIWDERGQALYWVDIKAPAVWRLDPKTGATRSWMMPHRIGAIAFRETGGLVAAMKPGFAFIDLDQGDVEIVARPEANVPDNRFNDGACDAQGRFWAGTMDDNEKAPTGHLYRLDKDLATARFEAGFVITNAIRWSNDGRRMYFVDSAARTIWGYDFDVANGAPGERRVFAQLGEADGWPDGLCVDADDHVWGAHWGAGRITRYRPDGVKERTIEIPAPNVTCCCFGGEDFATLYVTTARIGLDDAKLEAAPMAGGVFAVTGLGVRGRPASRFAG
jgi:sugar lactone lactonase YvrE